MMVSTRTTRGVIVIVLKESSGGDFNDSRSKIDEKRVENFPKNHEKDQRRSDVAKDSGGLQTHRRERMDERGD